MNNDGIARSATLGSVANAARVMKAFTPTEREWGVTDLARRLGIAKSTAHRLLATLTDEGLLEQDPATGRYRLGLVVFDLAAAAQSVDLHEAVLSPMTELRNRTGETVQVAVLDGREVVYVERLDSPNTLRLFLEVGRRNSAHRTGCGKALLAFLTPDQLDRTLRNWKLTAEDASTRSPTSTRCARTSPKHAGAGLRRQSPGVRGRCDLGRGADPRRHGSVGGSDQRRRPRRPARAARAATRTGDRRVGGTDLATARLPGLDRRRLTCAFRSGRSPTCPTIDASRSATGGWSWCVWATSCAPSRTAASTRTRCSTGGIVRNGVLSCPLHFWRYRIDDGSLIGSKRSLPRFPIDVVDGEAFVLLPDPPSPGTLRERLLDRARTYDRDATWQAEQHDG